MAVDITGINPRCALVLPLMDSVEFNRHLPKFHGIIVEYLTAHEPLTFNNNYVKAHRGNLYNMLSLGVGNTTIDLSIAFDQFYHVPVMYFRVNDAVDYSSPYGYMAVHLVLDVPFLMVHPCETDVVLASTNPASPMDYLISWFGITLLLVFPHLLLRVPVKNEYL